MNWVVGAHSKHTHTRSWMAGGAIATDDDACPMCMDAAASVVMGPCGHHACAACLATWRSRPNATCVICRGPLGTTTLDSIQARRITYDASSRFESRRDDSFRRAVPSPYDPTAWSFTVEPETTQPSGGAQAAGQRSYRITFDAPPSFEPHRSPSYFRIVTPFTSRLPGGPSYCYDFAMH